MHVKETPFSEEQVAALKRQVIEDMAEQGLQMRRDSQDRENVLLDYRFFGATTESDRRPRRDPGRVCEGCTSGPRSEAAALAGPVQAKNKAETPRAS